MKRVYLSLGSNIGDRLARLQQAVLRLEQPDFHITRISRVYETAPVDYLQQPHFLNAVVEADTTTFPVRLLRRIQKIERELGRERLVPKGPRSIDLDILLFGSFVVESAQLQIPHPRMDQRRFVLLPLSELAPELRHPVTKRTVGQMLAAAPSQLLRLSGLDLKLPRMPAEHGA